MSHELPGSSSLLSPLCISHLLVERARCAPNAPALLAPGRAALTYGRLYEYVEDVAQTLHTMGVGFGDRVALVLPNGPEMAVASLAVAAGAICAPLNPAYNTREFGFYLADLHAQALIVQAGIDSPGRAVAQELGIGVIELSPMLDAEAGLFTLTGETRGRTTLHGFAQPDDVAMVLHTSGTTSRAKLVPLTHTNICTRANTVRIAHTLTESDRCLNVMPLLYGHGLINTMLASLIAGASLVCAPGFDAANFFPWLTEFRPTWYTAGPSIHQAILERAALHREVIGRSPLRFIRSGTAHLSSQVLAELERVFSAPVIEIYGLTETSVITCHPLPPHERKIGSVGATIGLEVAIMDEMGTLLSAGETGEVVARGPTVMQGYENHPAANRSAFTHGWFRTGDAGYLDTDGYLFITGRIKEIINRGGEKIAPYEVEEVLMEHPAVAEVAAFAIPHTELGEEVAVAIVLRRDAAATEREIRAFAGERLADFKVPRRVVFIDEIPKGATGKVQRNSLAATLGLPAPHQTNPVLEEAYIAPRTPVELLIAKIWQDVLGVDRVSVYDNFFDLGGHSLLAMQVITSVEKHTGLRLRPRDLTFQTLGQLAAVCEAHIPLPQPSKPMNFLQKIWLALQGRLAK